MCNNVAYKPLFYLIKASGQNIVKRDVYLNYVCDSPLRTLLSILFLFYRLEKRTADDTIQTARYTYINLQMLD